MKEKRTTNKKEIKNNKQINEEVPRVRDNLLPIKRGQTCDRTLGGTPHQINSLVFFDNFLYSFY